MHLDRLVERHLRAGDGEAARRDDVRDIARADRAVELAAVARLAQQHEGLAVQLDLATASASFLRSRLLASSCAFWVAKYSRFALVARRAFFSGSRIVAGEAVLHLHFVAHLAEFLDAFEQDHLHGWSPTRRRRAAAP